MPDNALAILENQLTPLAPHLSQALAGTMPVERLIRTVLVSAERLPALLRADRQSLFMSAMSAACLGLEVDGVTGQAFLIPFAGRAQLIIGYKGYNTLAARGDVTITGEVVREGDEFEYELGTGAFVRHRPKLGNSGRIIGAWAAATHTHRTPIVAVMGIDDIMAVKAKSPGAKRGESPWNDPAVGFPAMASKTVKRRLARSMPLTFMQMAARMDEAVEEQGRSAYITPERGLEIDGEAAPLATYEASDTPAVAELTGPDVVAVAKAKAADSREAFDTYYATLSDADRRRVDAIRKPKKEKVEI